LRYPRSVNLSIGKWNKRNTTHTFTTYITAILRMAKWCYFICVILCWVNISVCGSRMGSSWMPGKYKNHWFV